MEDKQLIMVSEEEIKEYVFDNLISEGFAVTEDEAELLASIFFDYLCEKQLVFDVEVDE